MEKFSKWRDPGSGIQPFLPIKKTVQDNEINQIYLILNNFILGPLFGTLKFFLVFPVLIIWFGIIWILVVGVGCPFNLVRLVDILFGRLVMMLIGFLWLPSMKRMIIRPAIAALGRPESFSLHTEKSIQSNDSIQPGDWVITNLTSYCDLIWYWYNYSGIVMILNDFEDGKLVPCPNRFYVIYHYFLASENHRDRENIITTTNTNNNPIITTKSDYPLIIFPEGVSSNGRGVLKFIANLSSAKRNQRLHLTCTKFHSDLFTPSFVGPPGFIPLLSHLWQLCSQLQNTLTSRTILPSALFTSNFDLPLATVDPTQYNRTLQQIIAALGHLRPLNLDAKDKISFLKSFE